MVRTPVSPQWGLQLCVDLWGHHFVYLLLRSVLCPRHASASGLLLRGEWLRRVCRQRAGLLVQRGVPAGRQRQDLLQRQEWKTPVEQLPARLRRYKQGHAKWDLIIRKPFSKVAVFSCIQYEGFTPLLCLYFSFLTSGYAWNQVAGLL